MNQHGIAKNKKACHPEPVEGLRGEAYTLCFDTLSVTPATSYCSVISLLFHL